MQLHRFAPLIAAIAVFHIHAANLDTKSVPDGLMCEARMSDASFTTAWGQFMLGGVEASDGTIKFEGQHQVHGVCLRNVKVLGAFGVFGVIANLCTDDTSALLKHVRRTNSTFRERPDEKPPGILAVFEGEDKSFVAYRGTLNEPDPKATSVGYACFVKVGGTQ